MVSLECRPVLKEKTGGALERGYFYASGRHWIMFHGPFTGVIISRSVSRDRRLAVSPR